MIASKILRLAVLVSLFWRVGLLAGEVSRCGLVGPHGHELLGPAGPEALAKHLEAEAACQAGQTASAEPERQSLAAASGRVISTSGLASQGGVLAGWDLPAALPAPLALNLPGELWTQQHLAAPGVPSLELPPPSPPPCRATCPG